MRSSLRIAFAIALSTFLLVSHISNPLPAQEFDLPNAPDLQDPFPRLPVQVESTPIIDPDLTSWNEAGQDAERLGDVIRANWIMLSQTGDLTGTVSNPNNADLSGMRVMALRNGRTVTQTTVNGFGDFVLSGMTGGPVTLVGYSPTSFFTFGLIAVEYRAGASHMPRHITTSPITSKTKLAAGKLIQDNAPRVRFRLLGDYDFGEDDATRAGHFGFEGLSAFNVPSKPATTIQAQPINLSPGGRFRGRVHQMHDRTSRPVAIKETELKLLQDGRVVAETRCDRLGVFDFAGLATGEYGLVAVGADGFAAIAIQLVSPQDLETIPNRDSDTRNKIPNAKIRTVSTTRTRARQDIRPIDLTLVQPDSIGWINSNLHKWRFAEIMAQPRLSAPDPCPNCNPFINYSGRQNYFGQQRQIQPCTCGR